MRSVALILLIGLIGSVAAAALFADAKAAMNLFFGYFGAVLVLAASSFGYWQMVADAPQKGSGGDLRDPAERLEDPHALWDEEEVKTDRDAAEILKEEKARIKRQGLTFAQRLAGAKPALSVYRLAAYGVVVWIVISLIDSDRFEPVAFLVGAGAAPLLTAAALFWRLRFSP